jgi:anti-sigma28 factor (negative regulator of flagellin synthesis)
LGVNRQNPDTLEIQHLLLSAQAMESRAARVERLRALVAAGLYQVDAGAIARGILRSGRALKASRRPGASLDTQVCA